MRAISRRLFLIGTIGLGLLAVLTLRTPRIAAANPVALAEEAGDPPLIDLASYNQLIGNYRGKAVMVNFWATWCEPCRNEYPTIMALSKEYGPQGLAVVGVTLDDDADMNLVRRFLAQTHPNFPNFRIKSGSDAQGFYRGINPDWRGTMPQTDFYARDGHLARYLVGDHPREAFVQAIRLVLAVPVGQNGSGTSSAAGN
jgi:thiol-disulfide isomerase/thioredoxin